MAAPQLGRRFFAKFEAGVLRLAGSPVLQILVVGLLAVVARAAFLPWLGTPETNAFWQYNRRLFLGFLRAGVFSAVLFIVTVIVYKGTGIVCLILRCHLLDGLNGVFEANVLFQNSRHEIVLVFGDFGFYLSLCLAFENLKVVIETA